MQLTVCVLLSASRSLNHENETCCILRSRRCARSLSFVSSLKQNNENTSLLYIWYEILDDMMVSWGNEYIDKPQREGEPKGATAGLGDGHDAQSSRTKRYNGKTNPTTRSKANQYLAALETGFEGHLRNFKSVRVALSFGRKRSLMYVHTSAPMWTSKTFVNKMGYIPSALVECGTDATFQFHIFPVIRNKSAKTNLVIRESSLINESMSQLITGPAVLRIVAGHVLPWD